MRIMKLGADNLTNGDTVILNFKMLSICLSLEYDRLLPNCKWLLVHDDLDIYDDLKDKISITIYSTLDLLKASLLEDKLYCLLNPEWEDTLCKH